MLIGRNQGETRRFGLVGCAQLPIRDEVIDLPPHGSLNSMVSVWEPTPAEIEAISKGAKIYVSIIGVSHPPISVTVGEPLTDDDQPATVDS
jgi:hypothetical protein